MRFAGGPKLYLLDKYNYFANVTIKLLKRFSSFGRVFSLVCVLS